MSFRGPRNAFVPVLALGSALAGITLAQQTANFAQQIPPASVSSSALLSMSTAVYLPTFRALFGPTSTVDSNLDLAPNAKHDSPSSSRPLPTKAGLFTVPVIDDNQHKIECTVISSQASNATAVGYISVDKTTGLMRDWVGYTTNFSTFAYTQLSLPPSYTWSGDPLASANIFDNGIAPRRTYIVGTVFNGTSLTTPNAIGVWRSTDGGATWAGPVLAASNTNSNYFLDKPSIRVSWYTGNKGFVYVAYNRIFNPNGNQNVVFVTKSTDGGVTFGTPVAVAGGGPSQLYAAPMVLVGPSTGRVYVIWTDLTGALSTRRLLMAWSDDQGAHFTSPEVVAVGSMLGNTPKLTGNVPALSVSMARYNSVKNSIGVVWHEMSSDGVHTDVFFAAKTSSGWQPKVVITPATTNDQFMPALDFDASGNFIVTYYDRSDDPADIKYREKWVKIDYLGNRLSSGEVFGGFQSDTNQYYSNWVGDYQDVWFWTFNDTWGNRVNASWTGRPGTRVNPYLSGIN